MIIKLVTVPLKFISSILSNSEAGAISYDGYFYATGTNTTRELLNTYTSIIPTGKVFAGKAGQYAVDAYSLYICYANNLWIRILKDDTFV